MPKGLPFEKKEFVKAVKADEPNVKSEKELGQKRKASQELKAKQEPQKKAQKKENFNIKAQSVTSDSDDSDESSNYNEVVSSRKNSNKIASRNNSKVQKKEVSSSDSEDNGNFAQKIKNKKAQKPIEKKEAPKKKVVDSDSSSSEDDNEKKPVRKHSNFSAKKAKKEAPKKKVVESDTSSSEDDNEKKPVRKHSNVSAQKGKRETPKKETKLGEPAELYVGNLSWKVDEAKLKNHFSKHGKITNVKVLLGQDGRSRGAAFVSFAEKADAEKAVAQENGAQLEGRDMKCNISLGFPFDKEKEKHKAKSGVVGESSCLFVGNLGFYTTEDAIQRFFGDGATEVRIARDHDGRAKGFGHVEFSSAEAAAAALKLNGQMLDGRAVRLDLTEAKKAGGFEKRGPRRY